MPNVVWVEPIIKVDVAGAQIGEAFTSQQQVRRKSIDNRLVGSLLLR